MIVQGRATSVPRGIVRAAGGAGVAVGSTVAVGVDVAVGATVDVGSTVGVCVAVGSTVSVGAMVEVGTMVGVGVAVAEIAVGVDMTVDVEAAGRGGAEPHATRRILRATGNHRANKRRYTCRDNCEQYTMNHFR